MYVYIEKEISLCQRQLILLTISTLTYLLIASGIYALIEGWDYDDALYWSGVYASTVY